MRRDRRESNPLHELGKLSKARIIQNQRDNKSDALNPIRYIVDINPMGYIIDIYLIGDIMQTTIFTSMQLATMLKARRKTLRLTQKDVAVLVGLLPKTVSALETDPDRCSVESLRMLLSALKLELTLSPKDESSRIVREAEW